MKYSSIFNNPRLKGMRKNQDYEEEEYVCDKKKKAT
jgi:hypothetical protein